MKLGAYLAALVVATVLQAQIADRIAPPALRPDFIFAVALVYGLVCSDWTVTLAGFVAGLFESSLAGVGLAAFTVSRVVALMFVSYFVEPFNLNIGVGVTLAAAATLIAHFVYLLVQPMPEVLWWLGVAVRQTVVTAALVGALLYLLQRVVGAKALQQASAGT